MKDILRRCVAAGLSACIALSLLTGAALAVDEDTVLPVTSAEEQQDSELSEVEQSTTETDSEEGVPEGENPEETDVEESNPPQPIPLVQTHVQYIAGYGDGTVRPDEKLTRAQAAQIVYRLLENPGSGTGSCSYQDVSSSAWYSLAVSSLCRLGLFDDGQTFRPEDKMTRAEFVDLLVRISPMKPTLKGTFPDVPENYWAAGQIETAVEKGWIAGYPDGTFQPDGFLTRAEACTVINRMMGRTGDLAMTQQLLGLGLYKDINASHWAASTMAETMVSHTPAISGTSETWDGVNLDAMTFIRGFHTINGSLYYVNRNGKLVRSAQLGAYTADAKGKLTQVYTSYQMPNVPYLSQIDNIYAWVGCEAVATLMGLRAKGFGYNTTLKYFLDNLPRHSSNPEKGFVGSPYVPDKSKRTRTTIYPACLAQYSNKFCAGNVACSDFRGASIQDLKRELLAGNCVVGYMTLWWATPNYRNYNIEGRIQTLVSNNHAVLVCGYDPVKGYYISDPYNYYNRGQVYQYWEKASVFERIWNERKCGMLIE